MPDQDGLRFLFDIQDKITAKLAKIEAKSKASAAKIDKAFTRASRSQETNSAKAIAAEQRRIAAVEKAHAKSLALLKRQSDAFKKSMARLASAAAVAFAAVAGRAVTMAAGYDAAMRSVQAKTGASGALLDKLSAQAREMGRTTVHSATEAARGQAFLAQAGFDANEVLSALPGTLNLATAGELELSRAADIASNVLTGFALNVSEADRVADVLALTAQSTNTNVEQMGDAMKYAAAVAAAADADFEETAAAIGLLANAGFQGETGGTALRGAMSKLLNPTKAAQQILDELGISAVTSTGSLKPLHEIVGQFEDVGLTAGDAMKIFGQRAGPGMLALVSQGSGALVDLTGELKNAEGTAQKTADIMGGGLWGAIKKIQSIVESAYISLGERLGPAVEKVANFFAKLPAPIQEVVVVVGSMVAAMGGLMLVMPQSFGALVQFPGKLLTLVKVLKSTTAVQWLLNAALTANPIGLVIAAVAALAAGLYLLFTKTEIGRQSFRAMANVAKYYFAASIELAKWAIEGLAKWAGIAKNMIVALAKWAVIAKDKIVAMIPKWVIKSVEWLGKKVAGVTGKVAAAASEIEAWNEYMEASAGKTKTTGEAFGDLADVTTTVEKKTKRLPPVLKKADKAAEEFAKSVKNLTDTWTGATLKSGEFLRAFKKLTPEQKKNDRIMDQVLDTYNSMRKVLGPFNDELEAIWQTTEGLNPEIAAQKKETEKLEKETKKLAEKALKELNKEQEKLKKVAEELNDRLEAQRRRLLDLPTDEAIQSFEELTQTWEGLNEAEKAVATEKYRDALREAAKSGHELSDAQKAMAKSSESFFGSFKGGFKSMIKGITGGKGIKGVMEGIGKGITQGIGNIISGGLTALTNLAMKGIMSLGKKIWGGIKSLFGGKSKKRKEAEAAAAAAARAVAEAAAKAAEAAAAAQDAYWDGVYNSAINAYDRARAAGVAAYDEIFLAALESGLGQEEGGGEGHGSAVSGQ